MSKKSGYLVQPFGRGFYYKSDKIFIEQYIMCKTFYSLIQINNSFKYCIISYFAMCVFFASQTTKDKNKQACEKVNIAF